MAGLSRTSPRTLAVAAALWLATFLLYWPVHGFEFLSYDDGDYVTGNPHVLGGLTGANVGWAFVHFHSSNWHPLTWISHMLDVTLFGLQPGPHHLVNVALHSTNAALLFLILFATTGATWPSAFVAAVFAWHPLHVESVAWISERKDVLAVFFCLLAIAAYIRYVRVRSRGCYLIVLVFYAAALMAKPTAVTLPCLLLLLDYWPLRRANLSRSSSRDWIALLREKIPLITLAAASCFITLKAQQSSGSLIATEHLPLAHRAGNALLSYWAYLEQFVWPVNLAVFYPIPASLAGWKIVGAGLVFILGSVVSIVLRKKQPYLFAGWFWFIGALIPMIGLVQVGDQARADRYMYLPLIGLAIIVAWGIPELLQQFSQSPTINSTIFISTSALALLACLSISNHQLSYWHNGIALFQHALDVTKDNWYAHGNLATSFARRGRVDLAIEQYRKLLAIKPDSVDALNNLAWHLSTAADDRLRDGPEALALARRAVQSSKTVNASLLDTLAAALAENGEFVEATRTAQHAIELANAAGQTQVAARMETRLNAYRLGRSYRE